MGGEPLKSCEQYNATSNTWSEFPSMINARYDHGVAVVLGKIYVAGGGNYFLDVAITLVEVFNGTTWAELTSSPIAQPRFWCQAVSFQNKLVVLGGNDTTIEVFDPVRSTWNTTFPPMQLAPLFRVSLGAVSF